MVRPIHVGYIRWSSSVQEEGDSERRQRESIQADVAGLGITIDRWLQDAGLSASSGENLLKGELGRFLNEVKAGAVPPDSVLYLDEPTRLTRLSPSKAMRILADLEDAQVAIRLCSRHQTLSGDSLYELLGFLVESAAGHAFAKELGRKVHEAWLGKRNGARSAPGKEVLTSNTPYGVLAAGGTFTPFKGWSGRHYEPHPDEWRIVVLILEMARDGHSPRQIAVHLNEAGVPSPRASRGRKLKNGSKPVWRTETIRDIIKDRVYLDGSYQPCRGSSKKGKKAEGTAIVGHYPVFVPEGLWEAANAEYGKRSVNRGVAHRSGASNLFTGLIRCSSCGGTISLRSGNKSSRIPTLYCLNGREGACDQKRHIHRWRVEAAVLAKLSSMLDPQAIMSDLNRAKDVVDRGAVLKRVRVEVREKEKDVDALVDRVLGLVDSANADLYEARLTKAREELRDLQDHLARIEDEASRAEAVVSQRVQAARDFRALVHMAVYGKPRAEFAGRVDDIEKALKEAEWLDTELYADIESARIKLKAAIRRLVKTIVFDIDDETFAITLQTGQKMEGRIGEPLRLDGPDDVVPTAYGDF